MVLHLVRMVGSSYQRELLHNGGGGGLGCERNGDESEKATEVHYQNVSA